MGTQKNKPSSSSTITNSSPGWPPSAASISFFCVLVLTCRIVHSGNSAHDRPTHKRNTQLSIGINPELDDLSPVHRRLVRANTLVLNFWRNSILLSPGSSTARARAPSRIIMLTKTHKKDEMMSLASQSESKMLPDVRSLTATSGVQDDILCITSGTRSLLY